MFLLSRRQAHAAAAGVAAAAAWLAAAELSDKRPVRVGGLFVLSSMAMAGMATGVLSSRASAKAAAVEARFTNLINNGGSFGGNITVNGTHHVTGSMTVDGATTHNGNVNLTGNNISNLNQIDNGGSAVAATPGFQVNSGSLSTTGIISGGSRIQAAGVLQAVNTSGFTALAGQSSGWENGAQQRINAFISALG